LTSTQVIISKSTSAVGVVVVAALACGFGAGAVCADAVAVRRATAQIVDVIRYMSIPPSR
jgi:hypothetical protein